MAQPEVVADEFLEVAYYLENVPQQVAVQFVQFFRLDVVVDILALVFSQLVFQTFFILLNRIDRLVFG